MNTIARNIALTCCVALLAVPVARATDICWVGDESEFWDDETSWGNCSGGDAPRVPVSGDRAIIKAGADQDCIVRTDATVGVLEVESGIRLLEIGGASSPHLTVDDHAQIDGTVRIWGTATLELAGTATSTVNGLVVFWNDVAERLPSDPCAGNPTGTLLISDNSTIEGDGGVISGRECTGYDAPTRGIISTAVGKRLTLKTTSKVDPEPLLVVGYLDIQALLTNDSVHVGTSAESDVLKLSDKDKDGDSGKWFCEKGEFRVQTGVAVTGSNTWDMTEANAAAKLYFEANCECECLSGDFNIHNGVVYVYEDICTSGSVTVKSVNGSQPVIYGVSGNSASFAGVCAGCS